LPPQIDRRILIAHVNEKRDRVLIVDDNVVFLTNIQEFLNGHGFDVRVAGDGRAGLEIAETWRPDILLLDINMPVLNGFEVLGQLQKREIPTRVIMISGFFLGVSTAVECVRAGACDFLEKPCDPNDVAERLRRHIVLESTLASRVAVRPPSVDKVLNRALELEKELAATQSELQRIRDRKLLLELAVKASYVVLATAATAITIRMVGSSLGPAAVILVAVLLLLLLSSDRLQTLTAQWQKLKASIRLK